MSSDGDDPDWIIVEDVSYPYIYGVSIPINSISALQALNDLGDNTFFLAQDIDARETDTWTTKSAEPGFLPIGSEASPFNGTLDGNGHRIFGLHIYRPGTDQVGLFGYVGPSGLVRGVGLEQATITGGGIR